MQRLFTLLFPITLLAACATQNSTTPAYDMRFGDAVREARLRMTLNPQAGNQAPILGLDGRAAQEALGRYHESFRSPPPVVNVINIGGQRTGSSQ